ASDPCSKKNLVLLACAFVERALLCHALLVFVCSGNISAPRLEYHRHQAGYRGGRDPDDDRSNIGVRATHEGDNYCNQLFHIELAMTWIHYAWVFSCKPNPMRPALD